MSSARPARSWLATSPASGSAALTRLVWLGWLIIIVGFLGGVLTAEGATGDGWAPVAAVTLFVLAFATMGALVVTRQPRNAVGWILLAAGFAYTVGGLAVGRHGHLGPGSVALAWISTWVWVAGIAPPATFGLLLFPDGHLPSPRWRWVAWLAATAIALLVGGIAVHPGRLEDSPYYNPIGLGVAPSLPHAVAGIGGALLAVALACSVASLVVRFRRARSVQRQQLKWLTFSGVLVGIGFVTSIVIETVGDGSESAANLSNNILTLALATLPVAMAIAILRHRLYDIDVVINRTLVYAALTLTLAVSYLTFVLTLRLALSPLTGESDLAVAASTLAVAALFRPLRSGIQATVDRRFYRSRYDAARTLQGFSGRLRHSVDLDALGSDLRAVVDETMQPEHLSLWLQSKS
jgi:hypothetical protein